MSTQPAMKKKESAVTSNPKPEADRLALQQAAVLAKIKSISGLTSRKGSIASQPPVRTTTKRSKKPASAS